MRRVLSPLESFEVASSTADAEARLRGVDAGVPSGTPTAKYGEGVIVVSAALKGGVGKPTTAVYLAAVAVSNRNAVYLIDADPQASAADWIESAADELLQKISVV